MVRTVEEIREEIAAYQKEEREQEAIWKKQQKKLAKEQQKQETPTVENLKARKKLTIPKKEKPTGLSKLLEEEVLYRAWQEEEQGKAIEQSKRELEETKRTGKAPASKARLRSPEEYAALQAKVAKEDRDSFEAYKKKYKKPTKKSISKKVGKKIGLGLGALGLGNLLEPDEAEEDTGEESWLDFLSPDKAEAVNLARIGEVLGEMVERIKNEEGAIRPKRRGTGSPPAGSHVSSPTSAPGSSASTSVLTGTNLQPAAFFSNDGFEALFSSMPDIPLALNAEGAVDITKVSSLLTSSAPFMPPAHVFAKHRVAAKYYVDSQALFDYLMVQKLPEFSILSNEILRQGDVFRNPDRYDDFAAAVEGQQLVRTAAGSYDIQQNSAVEDIDILHAARRFREEITDPMLVIARGFDTVPSAILRHYNLAEVEDTWLKLRAIQLWDPAWAAGMPNNDEWMNDPALISAAREMDGLLNFNGGITVIKGNVYRVPDPITRELPTDDLSITPIDGYFSHQPMKNEKAILLDMAKSAQDMYGFDPALLSSALAPIQRRLEAIELLASRLRLAGPPNRDLIPGQAFYAPLATARDPAATDMLWEKDPAVMLDGYIRGVLHKVYMDHVLMYRKPLNARLLREGQGKYAAWIGDWANMQRGIRGLREDQGVATLVNNISKGYHSILGGTHVDINPYHIAKATSYWMRWIALSRLFFPPVRFPLVNLTQSGVTFSVEPRGTIQAVAYLSHHFKQAIEEAQQAGVISGHIDAAQMFLEIEGVLPSSVTKIEWVSQFLPNLTESLNRTIAFHAGKFAALPRNRGLNLATLPFVPNRIVIGYYPERDTEKNAIAYGRAMVETTQFRMTPGGKPTAAVGGMHRKLLGQFKTFGSYLASLMGRAIKHKEVGTLARLGAGLFMLGGIKTGISMVPGAMSVYDQFRKYLLRQGYDLPEGSGIGMVAHTLGLPQGGIDITGSFDPLNMPSPDAAAFINYFGGPTYGSIATSGFDLVKSLSSDPGGRDPIIVSARAIAPTLGNIAEVVQESRKGGIITPGGRVVAKRSPFQKSLRILGLQPSVRSERLKLMSDLAEVRTGGHMKLYEQLVREGKAKGINIGKKDRQVIRGRIKAKARRK
jgi:hypothetical protein